MTGYWDKSASRCPMRQLAGKRTIARKLRPALTDFGADGN
jgi:hypothetical protein